MKRTILRILTIICMLFISTACDRTSADQASSSYNKLCEIYKEIDAQQIEFGMKELKLAEKIQMQLPEFYKQHYVNIATVNIDRKYKLIKQLAEMESDRNWECAAIISYYEGVDEKK